MIVITVANIISFIAGFIIGGGVAILTRRYFYGKRMYVSGLPHGEESFKPRRPDTDLPPVDADRFNSIVWQINTQDEFARTYSRAVKERLS